MKGDLILVDKDLLAMYSNIKREKEMPSPFEIRDSSVEKIDNWLSNEGIKIDSLRDELEKSGKRCCLIRDVSDFYRDIKADVQRQIEIEEHDRYPGERWLQVLESIRTVVDLLGYLTLLQMDATATIISMLEARCDTERVVLSKHAYTLIHEVHDQKFNNRVSKEIENLPDVLIRKEDKRTILNGFNDLVKKIVPRGEAEFVRDKADAHKDVFHLQMEAYDKCNYGLGVASLFVFIRIGNLLQRTVEIMLENVPLLYEQYRADVTERLRKLERLLEKMKEYDGRPLPEGGLTGD